MTPREFIKFLGLAEKLKCNTRHSVTTSGRAESVAEHSWRLALMAMLLEGEFPELNMEKVIKMCLIHDLGEAVTGDIPTFLKNSKDEEVELEAVSGLSKTLPREEEERFSALFAEMNEMETKEAKLYKALDKCEALLQHNEADISSWLPLEYELQVTYGQKESDEFIFMRKLRDELEFDSRKKIEEELTKGRTEE